MTTQEPHERPERLLGLPMTAAVATTLVIACAKRCRP